MARDDTKRKPSTRKRMFWMLLITLIVFGAIFGIKAFGNIMMNRFFDSMPQPPATVSATVARAQTWTDALEAVGTLNAVNGIDVTTELGGVVRAIRFEPGERVRKGEVLVELNSASELATLKALESAAKLAVVQRDRWQELGAQKLVSQAEVDERTSQAATALAQAEAQRALIAQKTIRAPFDGILGIRKVNLGQYVNPGDPIVSLQQLDPIFLNFSLPEQRLNTIREGTEISARIDALPEETFGGRITAIEPDVDPNTRNFEVQATLSNALGKLHPGAFARVGFDVGESRKVVVVPQTAVSFNPYGDSVYVITEAPKPKPGEEQPEAPPAQDGAPQQQGPQLIAQQRFIKTGGTRGDLVAVTEGLKPGERIATSGLLKLRNGISVVINNEVRPESDARPDVQNR